MGLKRTLICSLLICCIANSAAAQSSSQLPFGVNTGQWVECLPRQSTYSASLRVTNRLNHKVTVTVRPYALQNARANKKLPATVTVAPKSTVTAVVISAINRQKIWYYKYEFDWRTAATPQVKNKVSPIVKANPKSNVYTLPWPPGYKYKVIQGYNGSFSHQGKNAIDFGVPDGEIVCAAREGIVIEALGKWKDGGVKEQLRGKANTVRIRHPDGTTARYVHFQYDGVLVKTGQQVKTGDPIGLAGSTGYSSGPHIHFEVLRVLTDKRTETIPVTFNDGSAKPVVPVKDKWYMNPFGNGASNQLPTNTLRKLTICRSVKDHEPVDKTRSFTANETLNVHLTIGVPSDYDIQFHYFHNGAKQPTFQRTLKAETTWTKAYQPVDLSGLDPSVGKWTVRVLFNGHPVGNTFFKVTAEPDK